jgi:hypothetical protein
LTKNLINGSFCSRIASGSNPKANANCSVRPLFPSATKQTRSKTNHTVVHVLPSSEDRSPSELLEAERKDAMRPDITFALPLREAQKNSAHPLFNFCSSLFNFVQDKKISSEICNVCMALSSYARSVEKYPLANLKKQPIFLKINDLCLKMNLKRT